MKTQGWIVLFTGLFVLPQAGFAVTDGAPYGSGMQAYPSTAGGWADRSARTSGYRFRPGWQAAPAESRTRQRLAAPGASPGYRFRPLPPARQAPVEQSVRYRPLQVRIPERYVFRPLKPVARSLPPRRVRSYTASIPTPYPPGGYRPYAYNPYPSWAYPRRVAGNYARAPWMGGWSAYPRPYQPQAYAPRMAQGMYPRRRVQPWANPRRTPRRGSLPGYVWRQPVPPRPAPSPAGRYVWGGAPMMQRSGLRQWEPVAQRFPAPPARLNRYGTNWYDGRGDGEGAWYRLVLESAPTVSQSWDSMPAAGGAE